MGLFSKIKEKFIKEKKIENEDIVTTNDVEQQKSDSKEENKKEKTVENVKVYEKGLTKSRENFVSKLVGLTNKYKKITDEYFDELEEILINADIGVETVINFIDRLKERVKHEKIEDTEYLKEIIVDELFIIYVNDEVITSKINFANEGPTIILFVGVNGVGKTTTTANLGSSLALEGKKVALIDTDIGLRNLDVVMGLENRIVYDIVDVVEEKCKLRQALIKDKRFNELFLLPAAQTRDKSAVNEEQMIELTNKLREEFDFILIDCPAGIEQGFKNAIAGADRALVVTTAEISAIRDADRIIGLLATSQIKNPELIINRIRPNMIKRGEMMDVEDIVELLSIDLIGVIPDDEYIITQTNKGEPAVSNKKSPSGRGYMEIAQRLLGENIEITIPGRNNGFVSKLLDIFKKK